MRLQQLQHRSEFLRRRVVWQQGTDQRVGVIKQLWVDTDRQRVEALSLQTQCLTTQNWCIPLNSIDQIGNQLRLEDTILERDALSYSSLINYEVITETGDFLGKVRDFIFDPRNGQISELIIASVSSAWLPSLLLSTYSLSADEIISPGPERLIVFEGAEERLHQLTVGLGKRLGINFPGYKQEDYYCPLTTTNRWNNGWEPPQSSLIGRRPWQPHPPQPLIVKAEVEPFDPPIP
jgi:sporulation protein YlmC with PRC-barrel domain